METTIYGIVGIVGVIIAWLTYQKTFHSQPTEELELLKIQFKATQTASKQLQELLSQYIIKFQAEDSLIFHGITFKQYITKLKQEHLVNLSDEILEKIINEKPSKAIINSMIKSLETQYNAIILIRDETSLKLSV